MLTALPSVRWGWRFALLSVFFVSSATLRADLVLEQQSNDVPGGHKVFLKVHGDQMRMDEPGEYLSVIVDLKTRDSITLFTNIKKYLKRSGGEVRQAMEAEKRATGGANELDAAPAPAVDTGGSEALNGRPAAVYSWPGANHLTETLWVDRNFPNYDAIRAELAKVDAFNDGGPHRNAQPALSRLPGMVLKSETVIKGRILITTLVSVTLEPVDPGLFKLPADYLPWKPVGQAK